MSDTPFVNRVLQSFAHFIREIPPSTLSAEQYQCLADYILAWVKSGRGAQVCKRDFAALQVASLIIANWWLHYPNILDYAPASANGQVYVERRVHAIFTSDYEINHEILNPHIFG